MKVKNAVAAMLALLMLTPAAWAKLSAHEEARVEAMLGALSEQQGLVFIRNGSEHTREEAVSHLRLKLKNTRNRINTADQFIDKVASSSSITGKPYTVRISGKGDENASVFLHRLIEQTDASVK
ncbi:YfeK family protein [Enterobacteriaceae bacterium 4M9]|nr:YfeK family protein [Enterobacteriaceae bacterium 4M9]